jgi:acetyl-CoA acetyltransferase
MSFTTGVGLTSCGKHQGLSSLDLMSKAAALAKSDAGLTRAEIDGNPPRLLHRLSAHHAGDRVRRAFLESVRPTRRLQVDCATGLAMTMLAHHLVARRRRASGARGRR